jgi:hypothetical protein
MTRARLHARVSPHDTTLPEPAPREYNAQLLSPLRDALT